MFGRIRKRLTYVNVVATLALVFAMSGGALAASRYIITSTKQISPKVLTALKGAKGAAGANGLAGAVGATGPGGAQGPQGSTGTSGSNGKDGEQGPQGSPGKNGKNGENGEPGEPWTPDNVLPPHAKETGVWGFYTTEPEGFAVEEPVASFPIQLGKPPTAAHFINTAGEEVHFEAPSTPPTGCGSPVGTEEEPKAEPGNLCIYESIVSGLETGTEAIVHVTNVGAFMQFVVKSTSQNAAGSWAVTAE